MKTTSESKFSFVTLLVVMLSIAIITGVGLVLLHKDIKSQRMDAPASVYEVTEKAPLPKKTAEPKEVPAELKLDINKATQAELETLPGIGEGLARRIIEYRNEKPFKVIRDLKKVSGIGDKTFAAISGLVFVGEIE